MLLDTNALLWVLTDDPRLGSQARERLVDGRQVYFSSVSILEITIKEMLGRLDMPADPAVAATSLGLTELPFSSAHARELHAFPDLARHDPFDRMLLAQATTERVNLLTSDRVLLNLALTWVDNARD